MDTAFDRDGIRDILREPAIRGDGVPKGATVGRRGFLGGAAAAAVAASVPSLLPVRRFADVLLPRQPLAAASWVITGPTGAGKSTLLHAAFLEGLQRPRFVIEYSAPIEYAYKRPLALRAPSISRFGLFRKLDAAIRAAVERLADIRPGGLHLGLSPRLEGMSAPDPLSVVRPTPLMEFWKMAVARTGNDFSRLPHRDVDAEMLPPGPVAGQLALPDDGYRSRIVT